MRQHQACSRLNPIHADDGQSTIAPSMWQPSHFTTRRTTLDFSSSDGGTTVATQLLADGELIANAIELIDFSDDPVQVTVCEECGHTDCQPGGWVSFRRCGPNVLVLPAFAAMAKNEREYAAPIFLQNRGLVLLAEPMFSILRSFAKDLPPIDQLAPLSAREAVLAYQWQAPGPVLGKFPSPPALDPALVLATDPGEPGEQVQRLNLLLAKMFACDVPVHPTNPYATVTLYLDLPGYPAWQALSGGDRLALVLGEGLLSAAHDLA